MCESEVGGGFGCDEELEGIGRRGEERVELSEGCLGGHSVFLFLMYYKSDDYSRMT